MESKNEPSAIFKGSREPNIFPRKKLLRLKNKWKSVGTKSFNSFNFSKVVFATCGLALSCWSITPFLLTNAGSFFCNSSFKLGWVDLWCNSLIVGSSSQYTTPLYPTKCSVIPFSGVNRSSVLAYQTHPHLPIANMFLIILKHIEN